MPFDHKTPHLAPAFGIAPARYEELLQAITTALLSAIHTANHPNQVKAQAVEAVLAKQSPTVEEAALIGLMVEQSYNAALQHASQGNKWPFKKK
jgi:hypothetical protein